MKEGERKGGREEGREEGREGGRKEGRQERVKARKVGMVYKEKIPYSFPDCEQTLSSPDPPSDVS